MKRPRGLGVVAVAVVALCLAPVAGAKLKLWLEVDHARTSVGKPVKVVLRSERALDFDLRLIAVAPGKDWYDVVGVVTGDSSLARAKIPRDGFEIPVTRAGPGRWRAVVKFPRRGRWRLVIPNGAPEGFMIPPPAVITVVVRGG